VSADGSCTVVAWPWTTAVTMLAGVLEFQRDMISENTKEGVTAAEAARKTLGRPAALDEDQAADVVDLGTLGGASPVARRAGTRPKLPCRLSGELG
jgi:DNA invertase Pin-like site-specific DNA recombinase